MVVAAEAAGHLERRRDAAAARQLGFVPTHGIGAALAMAHGRADRPPRIGYLLSPPYFPIRVSG